MSCGQSANRYHCNCGYYTIVITIHQSTTVRESGKRFSGRTRAEAIHAIAPQHCSSSILLDDEQHPIAFYLLESRYLARPCLASSVKSHLQSVASNAVLLTGFDK
jgi:hypothetical protein